MKCSQDVEGREISEKLNESLQWLFDLARDVTVFE